MNKAELLANMAEKSQLTKAEAERTERVFKHGRRSVDQR